MSLDKRKKELELARVKLAKDELEYKIAERQEEIKRLIDHITIQNNKIEELTKELIAF